MMNRSLLYLFGLLSLLHLFAEQYQMEWLILSTKPLLVSILAVWFYQAVKPLSSTLSRMLLIGLLFSVGGDTLLMLVENGPRAEVFFLLGLGSFLIAQVSYTIAFTSHPKARQGLLFRQASWAFPFLFYLAGMLFILWPGIPPEMQIPVTIYAFAIVGMAISAANLYGQIPNELFWGLFGGILLFVLSDTLIAINKFVKPLSFARLAIMLTYLGAQLLIVWFGRRIIIEEAS